ncbi:MAG: flagellar hook-basal body complex protein, partial [Deltaproteobacteria bacterium]|nr:flagellar hook-basal body complex protein [Deltaproteobacteria bacterium]
DSEGVVNGIFSNGRTRAMGQIVLADFPSPETLIQMGSNLFGLSTASGEPLLGAAGSSGLGVLHASTLELSTVDIADEFIGMISAQRGFQANSKVITTSDEILAELINLKR